MCLILFAHQASPDYPLIVAANRDEFYTRPTTQASFWQDSSAAARLLAGQDKLAGGTWLGMTRSGRFAAVTNIRDPSQAELKTRSRGELTRDFLLGTTTPEAYCGQLQASFDQFAGYNLLVGDRQDLYYVNNFSAQVAKLNPGVYGLSNGDLDSDWPKVNAGKQRLSDLLSTPGLLSTDRLIALMSNHEKARDSELPDTGIGKELERSLSSAFIVNTERLYGTVCSTALILEQSGKMLFSEQNYGEAGTVGRRHFFEMTVAA